MDDKYIKVVYESKPIGKEKIVLQLTTFDLEAFEKDEKLKKIPIKKDTIAFEFDKYEMSNPNLLDEINNRFEKMFNETYKKQLEDMKSYIEINRRLPKAQWYEEKVDE